MSAADDRQPDDPDRRDFLKKLAAVTSGAVASGYVVPRIALAQAGGGLSAGPLVPMVIVQSLFEYIQTQGSPAPMVIWMVENTGLSQSTAIFVYDTTRAMTNVDQLNEFLNGSNPIPGLPPGPLGEARAATATASAHAAEESKWPWE